MIIERGVVVSYEKELVFFIKFVSFILSPASVFSIFFVLPFTLSSIVSTIFYLALSLRLYSISSYRSHSILLVLSLPLYPFLSYRSHCILPSPIVSENAQYLSTKQTIHASRHRGGNTVNGNICLAIIFLSFLFSEKSLLAL